MDSQEIYKLNKKKLEGRHPGDEGPYYHAIFMEGFKGEGKGLLAGLGIGGITGLVAGAAATTALTLLVGIPLTPMTLLAVPLSCTALGAWHGAHVFSDIGSTAAIVGAGLNQNEERMKAFNDSRFAELKRDLRDLKNLVAGKLGVGAPQSSERADATPTPEEVDRALHQYQDSHCNDGHCPPGGGSKIMFWKIAGICGLIGAAAGAMFGGMGLFTEMLDPLKHALESFAHTSLSTGQIVGASAVMGATIGGAIGVNRDIYRHIADQTDHLYKGYLPGEWEREQQRGIAKAPERAPSAEIQRNAAPGSVAQDVNQAGISQSGLNQGFNSQVRVWMDPATGQPQITTSLPDTLVMAHKLLAFQHQHKTPN